MSAVSITQFATDIEAERDCVKAFLKILQQEQDILVSGEVDPLTDLAHQKIALVKQLAEFSDKRNLFLRSLTLSPDRQGMEAWLGKNPANSTIRAVWEELLTSGKTARQFNQTNGVLINTRLRHNQKALALLQSAAQSADLYGPDGQTSVTGTGRTLGTV